MRSGHRWARHHAIDITLIMMHRGRVIADLSGAQKSRLRPDDLLARFKEVRCADLLDEAAAHLLAEPFV
jgi:putative ABC transport system ATP-binding protein